MNNDSSYGGSNGDGEFIIDNQIKNYLSETAKWGKFIAIVGLVLVVLGLLMMLFTGSILGAMGAMSDDIPTSNIIGGGFMFIITAILSLVYVIPLWYLWKFSTRMQVALKTNDQHTLNESFRNLKSLYKFVGIFLCIIIGFYTIIFAFAIVMGSASI